MEYMGIGICIVVVVVICIVIRLRTKKYVRIGSETGVEKGGSKAELPTVGQAQNESIIRMELLPAETIEDNSKLAEITDSKLLAHINNLIPGLAQIGNAANNAIQAARAANGEVLYRAILPPGVELMKSKDMEGAVRGIYREANKIGGHANFKAVDTSKQGATVAANSVAAAMGIAAMVVGQYYMARINAELGVIREGISQIAEFQDNEYRSRVFSLIAHVMRIAEFQTEILENDELRYSKISQLDSLEEECTQLLGQANLTLAGVEKRAKLNYQEYKEALEDAQNWFMYQQSLLDVLYRISDLRYTLHVGCVSREQCGALLPTYTKQVNDTQERLTMWHQEMTKRLGIHVEEIRRKRMGVDGVVHFLPGLFNDNFRFRSIEEKTARMIDAQASGYEETRYMNMTELYNEDVQLIIKDDGKIYFLSESKEQ